MDIRDERAEGKKNVKNAFPHLAYEFSQHANRL